MSPRFPRRWQTARLDFRPPAESDVDDLTAMCRDTETLRFLTHLPVTFDERDARRFLAGPAAEAWSSGRAIWVATDRDTDRVVGRADIARLAQPFGSAEIGYIVTPAARGHGFAAEMTAGVADVLFGQGFARAELHIREDNIASQRVALRAGFGREARLRQGYPDRAGQRYDRLMYTRVTGDSPGPVPRALPDLPAKGLRDGHIILRPLCPGDAAQYHRQSQRPEEWRRSVPPLAPAWETVTRLCGYRAAGEWLDGRTARMSIRDDRDRYAGTIALHTTTGPPGESMLSYGLLPEYQGRGMATRAVRLLADWAFRNTDTVRLMAGTAIDNAASRAVLRRAGFTEEGVQRDLLPGPDDDRVDNVCWSLLRAEH